MAEAKGGESRLHSGSMGGTTGRPGMTEGFNPSDLRPRCLRFNATKGERTADNVTSLAIADRTGLAAPANDRAGIFVFGIFVFALPADAE